MNADASSFIGAALLFVGFFLALFAGPGRAALGLFVAACGAALVVLAVA